MIEIFKTISNTHHAVSVDGRTDYLVRNMNHEIDKLKEYYANTNVYINNRHPLLRLLKSGYVDVEIEPSNYMQIVENRSDDIARSLGMNTEVSPGRLFDGGFYKTEYLILAHNSKVDFKTDYKSLSPVTVLFHDETDLAFPFINELSSLDIPVISINLNELFWMYRQYCLKHENPTEQKFITQYVVPGMFKSYLVLALYNRLVNISKNVEMERWINRHPISVRDFSKTIDSVLTNNYKKLQGNIRDVRSVFNYIPYSDALSTLQLPDVTPLIQVEWLLGYSRIEMAMEIVSMINKRDLKNNKSEIHNLLIYIDRLIRSNALTKYLPSIFGKHHQNQLVIYHKKLKELT